MKKQLDENQEIQNRSDLQINTLLTNIRMLQDEKNSLEVKLSQKQSGYEMQVNFIYIILIIYFVTHKFILVKCFTTKVRRMRAITRKDYQS